MRGKRVLCMKVYCPLEYGHGKYVCVNTGLGFIIALIWISHHFHRATVYRIHREINLWGVK